MTAARAVEVRQAAVARWGKSPPADLVDALDMLKRITQTSKPDAVLGPTMAAAVNTISRRLREEGK